MSAIIPFLVGFFILGFLVFIHEAGHFLAARAFGVRVLEFGLGFPYLGRAFKFKRGHTTYSISWLFFGGFVQLYGEDAGTEKLGPESFAAKNVWIRFFIAAAGIIVNILFAILLFATLVASSGFKADLKSPFPVNFPFGITTTHVLISGTEKDSPAELAGLKPQDKILSIDGKTFATMEDVQSYVRANLGQPLTLVVQNLAEEESRTIVVVPRVNPPEGQGALGIGLDSGQTLSYNSIIEKILVGPMHSANMLYIQGAGLAYLISESSQEGSIGPIQQNVSGPVGVVYAIGEFVKVSGNQIVTILLTMTALISLGLGIGNLLPIPALDGGRLAFIFIEGVTGKKVKPRTENMIHGIGFIILLLLLALITANDVRKILTGTFFG